MLAEPHWSLREFRLNSPPHRSSAVFDFSRYHLMQSLFSIIRRLWRRVLGGERLAVADAPIGNHGPVEQGQVSLGVDAPSIGLKGDSDLPPALPGEAPSAGAQRPPSTAPLQPDADVEDADEVEDAEPDEEDEDIGEGPDFFTVVDSSGSDDKKPSDLDRTRVAARLQALQGQHRIFPSSPSGPGSLAEALNQALAEDLIEADFVDDPSGEPFVLYTPRNFREA